MSDRTTEKVSRRDLVAVNYARNTGSDNSWPGDNYEVTTAMALVSSGWKFGFNLFHLCFTHAEHDESFRGKRLHLPMQYLNGSVVRNARVGNRVLNEKP